MLKVLVNAVSAKSGGTATYIMNLARSLRAERKGHEYIVLVPGDVASRLGDLGAQVRVVASDAGRWSGWRRLLWDQVALRRVCKREKVDVLLSSSDFGMLFPRCKQVLMIRNLLFFSDTYHQTMLPLKSARFRLEFFLRRALIVLSARSADLVIVPSETMLRSVRRFISLRDEKAVVNYFGVPLDQFMGQPGRSRGDLLRGKPGRFDLLFVSEYSDYKNLTALLKAMILLRERGEDGVYLVSTADPGQFANVEVNTRVEDAGLARHPSIAGRVKFTGAIPYERVAEVYARSDLFVFPSLVEAFAHPLVEAMASGLPILASDIPICREICGEGAVYFSALDANDLCAKILALRDNEELRMKLGKAGRERAEAHFDWKDHVRRLVGSIEQVAEKRASSEECG